MNRELHVAWIKFQSRPKSHALSTAGSVMTSNFINKWMLALKNSLTRENKID